GRLLCFFFQAEDGIRDFHVTGVQTCALPIFFMVRGQNTTAVVYRLAAGPPGAVLVLQPLINCRDYHHTVRANDWPFRQRPWECGAEIVAYPGAPPLILEIGRAHV